MLIFLLVYEGSPLNQFLREDEARNLYNQALECYELENYETAIEILDDLAWGKYGFYGDLSGTEWSRKADEELPNWEFEYAEHLREDGKIVESHKQLNHVLFFYPELNVDLSSTKIQEWTMEYARYDGELDQINLGYGKFKDLGGNSEIVIMNDSPRNLRVYTCGSISKCIMIEANDESSIYKVPPFNPSNSDVKEVINLPAGSLEIAITTGSLTVYGDLNLEKDTTYKIWFYMLQSYG